jgi:hypothetical protein
MSKRTRHRHAWTVEWKQVYQRDREERLQQVFALIVPHAEAKTHRHTGEQSDVQVRRPLRQSVQ